MSVTDFGSWFGKSGIRQGPSVGLDPVGAAMGALAMLSAEGCPVITLSAKNSACLHGFISSATSGCNRRSTCYSDGEVQEARTRSDFLSARSVVVGCLLLFRQSSPGVL